MKKAILILLGISLLATVIYFGFIHDATPSYLYLDANAQVELAFQNDEITAVNALDEDADAIVEATTLVGLSVDQAVVSYFDTAIALGYTTFAETSASDIEMLNEEGETLSRRALMIRRRILVRLDQYFVENGLWAMIIGDLETIPAEAEALGITEFKLRVIKAIQSVDATYLTETGIATETPALIRLMRSLQPVRAYIERLNVREAEIDSLVLETTEEAQLAIYQAELDEIAANRGRLAEIRAQFVADRARFMQNRQDRIDAFLTNHPRIAERIQERINHLPNA